jgi:hypothetical protein
MSAIGQQRTLVTHFTLPASARTHAKLLFLDAPANDEPHGPDRDAEQEDAPGVPSQNRAPIGQRLVRNYILVLASPTEAMNGTGRYPLIYSQREDDTKYKEERRAEREHQRAMLRRSKRDAIRQQASAWDSCRQQQNS